MRSDLRRRVRHVRGPRGVPRQGGAERGRRARGGVRPQPAEGLPVRHETGAKLEARARVHRDPAGDVQPQVHAAPQRAEATLFRVVPG